MPKIFCRYNRFLIEATYFPGPPEDARPLGQEVRAYIHPSINAAKRANRETKGRVARRFPEISGFLKPCEFTDGQISYAMQVATKGD